MSKEFITEDRLRQISCTTDGGYHTIDLGAAVILFGYHAYTPTEQAEVRLSGITLPNNGEIAIQITPCRFYPPDSLLPTIAGDMLPDAGTYQPTGTTEMKTPSLFVYAYNSDSFYVRNASGGVVWPFFWTVTVCQG